MRRRYSAQSAEFSSREPPFRERQFETSSTGNKNTKSFIRFDACVISVNIGKIQDGDFSWLSLRGTVVVIIKFCSPSSAERCRIGERYIRLYNRGFTVALHRVPCWRGLEVCRKRLIKHIGEKWRSADLFDTLAVCSTGFDTIPQKIREIYCVFRRFFCSNIVIRGHLILHSYISLFDRFYLIKLNHFIIKISGCILLFLLAKKENKIYEKI